MSRDALNWTTVYVLAFAVLYGLILSAEACSRAFDDVEAESAELEAMPCECVIEVIDPRVPLVVSGRAVEVGR